MELETFFDIHADKERCHTAKILSDAYKNKQNKIILIFLRPVLKQIFKLNTYFQKNDIDYFLCFSEINSAIWAFARQILKPALLNHLDNNLEKLQNSLQFENNYLQLKDCDFGFEFERELNELHLPLDVVTNIKKQCVQFLKILIEELTKRMPSHLDVFSQIIRNINPKIILNVIRPKFTDFYIHFVPRENVSVSDIEIEYRQFLTVQWNEVFQGEIPEDTLKFWQKIITLKNASGDLLFKNISLYAFTLLSLPSSNASVERSFSIMNIVKSKLRNQMMLKLLNSIMLIKSYFHVHSLCCKTFEPTTDMFHNFNSTMYKYRRENENGNNNNENDVVDVDEIIYLVNEI